MVRPLLVLIFIVLTFAAFHFVWEGNYGRVLSFIMTLKVH